ncbi:MAG: hypothetical protein JRJ35_11270 [Deltaproteobacteria bacterium]|nr:hypothetical protein [Deltaproteobacteria bacterium]
MEETQGRGYILKSIGALLTGCVAFAIVLFLANALLYLLNWTRSTENNWLETIFRELASPAAGSYAAMVVADRLFKTYNKNFVFFGFSALIVAFIAASLTVIFLVWSSGRFSVYDVIMQTLTAPICIATAYYAYRDEMQKEESGP